MAKRANRYKRLLRITTFVAIMLLATFIGIRLMADGSRDGGGAASAFSASTIETELARTGMQWENGLLYDENGEEWASLSVYEEGNAVTGLSFEAGLYLDALSNEEDSVILQSVRERYELGINRVRTVLDALYGLLAATNGGSVRQTSTIIGQIESHLEDGETYKWQWGSYCFVAYCKVSSDNYGQLHIDMSVTEDGEA
ncbi:MAG: hypothetical protein Q4C01_01815 [Clostridia bacterium]|nr:hypothetical protein [Clostridia bacterium]